MTKRIIRNGKDADNLAFAIELLMLEHQERLAFIDYKWDRVHQKNERKKRDRRRELEIFGESESLPYFEVEVEEEITILPNKSKANRRKKTATKANNRKHLRDNMEAWWDDEQKCKVSLGYEVPEEKELRYKNGDWNSDDYQCKKFRGNSLATKKSDAKAKDAIKEYFMEEAIELLLFD